MVEVSKIIVRNDEDEILVLKKASGYGEMSDKWEIPGGKLEGEESRFDAGRRELEEETGLEASDLQDVMRMELEDEEVLECHVLFTESFTGKIRLCEEHSEYRWVPLDDAPEIDWHRDASWIVPVLENLSYYRD